MVKKYELKDIEETVKNWITSKQPVIAGYKTMPNGLYIGIIGLLDGTIIGHFWEHGHDMTFQVSKKFIN